MVDVMDLEPLPPDHPLWRFSDVVITPHEVGYTSDYYQRCVDILADNVERLSKTGSNPGLRNQVHPQ
jgi:phosphoglycerate dehydrogenase-like enzyme